MDCVRSVGSPKGLQLLDLGGITGLYVTQQKNEARRELRAARRDGRDQITIREVARKFHTLIRLHSKTKLKAKFNLEAGKARRECARHSNHY